MNPNLPSQTEIHDFLHRFRRALASLPVDIREDLVDEVRSHLEERFAQGKLDLKESFGSPEDYASGFLAEGVLHAAVNRGNPWDVLAVLLGKVQATTITVFVVIPLAVLELMGIALTLTGFLKPIDSRHVGLFLREDGGFGALGWMSDSGSMHETLGYAAMPLFIFCGLLLFWISHKLMLNVARHQLARLRMNRGTS